MKNAFCLFVLTIIIISCTTIVFKDPQPLGAKSLKSIPAELRGSFSFVILNEKTIMEIGENYVSNQDGKTYLSDSLIIKKLGNRYVLNTLSKKDKEDSGNWEVFVLENKGCGFVKGTSFSISSDSYLETFKTLYSGRLIGEGQEKTMVLRADADQFNALLKDDSVTISIILERLD